MNFNSLSLTGRTLGTFRVGQACGRSPKGTLYEVVCLICSCTGQRANAAQLNGLAPMPRCGNSACGKTGERRKQYVPARHQGSVRDGVEHGSDPDYVAAVNPTVQESTTEDSLSSDPEYRRVVEESNRLGKLTSQFQMVDKHGNVIEETQ